MPKRTAGEENNTIADVTHEAYYDVIIVGGGLAGLTLARQIRRELPQWTVAVVERHARPIPEAAWKVGESSVEVGARYLEELGLSDYLLERQLVKFGLRFFPGGGHLPIQQRTEIGPSQEPLVKSYQLDRGRFESDLRAMLERDGVRLLEGYKATDVLLAEAGSPLQGERALHHLQAVGVRPDAHAPLQPSHRLSCRWLLDSSGREAVLRRRLELRTKTGHTAHAGWFRVQGRVDVNDWVDADAGRGRWFRDSWSPERWRSTIHLMGPGYWCWIIPLSSGNTSIGVVVHEEFHAYTDVASYEACLSFLRSHEPELYGAVRTLSVMDFHSLRGYSHGAAHFWSPNRYGLVGEAGAFVDPLYSPGSDFIAFANGFTVNLLRRDYDGEPLETTADAFNERYRQLVAGGVELYRQAGPIYGHAAAMAAKVYFDNFAYWSFFAQYYFQKFFTTLGPDHDAYVDLGVQLAVLSKRVQALLRAWSCATESDLGDVFVGMPRFPSLLVDVYMDLREPRNLEAATRLLELRVMQAREIAAELALRVLVSTGPVLGPRLLWGDATHQPNDRNLATMFEHWGITPSRIDAEMLRGLDRRRALSPATRDVERTLGRVSRHPQWLCALGRSPEPAPSMTPQ